MNKMFKAISITLVLCLSTSVHAADEAKAVQSANKIKDSILNKSTVNQAGRDIVNNTTYVLAPKPTPAKKSKTKSKLVAKTQPASKPKTAPVSESDGDTNTLRIGSQTAEKIINATEINGNIDMGN